MRQHPWTDKLAWCLVAALALTLPVTCAADPGTREPAQVLQIPSLKVQLLAPPGWVVLRTVEGKGVTVGSPDGGSWLDVLAWEPVAERLSASAAAAAHEQILSVRMSYKRQMAQPFRTPEGNEALSVLGTAQAADGRNQVGLFSAYRMDRRYLVVGTFCAPDQTTAVKSGYYDQAVLSLAPLGAATPAPTIATTPEKPTVPAPVVAEPLPVVEYAGVPSELVTYEDGLGFTVQAPSGWPVGVDEGCVLIWSPDTPVRYGVAIWPLLRTDKVVIQERAMTAVKAWAEMLGAGVRITQERLASGPELTAVLSGELRLDGTGLSFVAALVPSQALDVLQVLILGDDAPESDRCTLAQVLASFTCPALQIASQAGDGGTDWRDSTQAIQAHVDSGWLVTGGVTIYNEQPVINLVGRHLASGASFTWQQPEMPCFKSLTPALTAAGWQEGADYPPDRGTQPLVLARKLPVAELARRRSVGESGYKVVSAASTPHAAQLLKGGQGAGSTASDALGQASCLCAVAAAPAELGEDCWMAATLRYEGPRDSYQSAGAALRTLILSASVPTEAGATPQQKVALMGLIEGAKQAALDLPAKGPELAAVRKVTPAFSLLVTDNLARSRSVTFTPNLGWLWKVAADAAKGRQHLPELFPAEEAEAAE